MENFKKGLQGKMTMTVWAAALNEALYLAMNMLFKERVSDFASNLSTYLSIALFIYAFVQWFRYMLMVQDGTKLEAAYIKSKDERNIMIREKTSGASYMISVYMLCAGVIVSSFFSQGICIAFACVIIAMLLVNVCCKLYYERKY